ncbi:GGDEF domain-containing protein [Sulfurimonas crateris]|uniref:GGDEF domain-containing protein n=1 Tax=Sulfurimonas crateris TaxID=2574727 RepID=A0A4V5TM39_9BACT|nr:GGDEF domain-containing protein [Sulfurimonas crateris]
MIRKEDTVARLGGDEFVVLLSDLSDNESEALEMARNVSQKIHSVMDRGIFVGDVVLNVTLSLGVALIGKDGETVDEALKHADMAMYNAKDAGRNCTKFYSRFNGRGAKEV